MTSQVTGRKKQEVAPTPPQLSRRETARYYNPKLPELIQRHCSFLWSAFFLLFAVLLVHDTHRNALGTSNGAFVSIVDTVNGLSSYRASLPHTTTVASSGRFAWITLTSLICKFAAGGMVSVLLDKQPVFLQNTDHILRFGVGFGLVWLSPDDIVYKNVRNSMAVRFLVLTSTGLYKMRKSIFAVETAFLNGGDFVLACLLVLITLDGNSVVAKSLIYFEKVIDMPRFPTIASFFGALLKGFREVLMYTIVPDVVVTGLIWNNEDFRPLPENYESTYFEFRIFLLIYFAWRQRAFDVLAQIHQLSSAQSPTAKKKED